MSIWIIKFVLMLIGDVFFFFGGYHLGKSIGQREKKKYEYVFEKNGMLDE